MGASSVADRAAAILASCLDDPALFVRAVLGSDMWAAQEAVCDSVARYPITVVPAGRAVGKSWLLARIVLWFLFTRPYAQVITTGPDHRQVLTVLWKEIRKALRPRFEGGVKVAPRVDLKYDHLTRGMGSPQQLIVKRGTEWGALGFACKSDEGLSGQHAPELLVIVDEATGVPPQVWAAIHGAAATRYLFVGNPIKYHCHFRELHDLAATSETINSVRISSLDSPHAGLETSPFGMASRQFLQQMREIHGEGSPWWRSNILGEFPGAEASSFVDKRWLNACLDPAILDHELWKDAAPGPNLMGVDPGGGVGADPSTIVVRNHKRLLDVFSSKSHGVLDDAEHRLEPVVVEKARKWRVMPEDVTYDKNGPGRNLGSYLEKHGLAGCYGYFGGGKGGRWYADRRTACAFAARNRLDPNRSGHVPFYAGGVPGWEQIAGQLGELRSPTMEFSEDEVKQRLETKAELMGRLKRSPDELDAFLMTFARRAA